MSRLWHVCCAFKPVETISGRLARYVSLQSYVLLLRGRITWSRLLRDLNYVLAHQDIYLLGLARWDEHSTSGIYCTNLFSKSQFEYNIWWAARLRPFIGTKPRIEMHIFLGVNLVAHVDTTLVDLVQREVQVQIQVS